MEPTPVVTCFLRNAGAVLLLRRSTAVGSYVDRWGAVAGHAEGDPETAATVEIQEETGLDPDADVACVRRGEPFTVTDEELGVRWHVHPFLFDADRRDITTNEETDDWEWVSPTELLRRETVPDLWRSYDSVRPSVRTIAEDTDHGSAWLSIRTLEVLRDEAGLAAEGSGTREDWQALRALAEDLAAARPAMPVVRNRVNRAMTTAASNATPAALTDAGRAEIARAIDADGSTARAAGERIDGRRVATVSRSGTVERALRDRSPAALLVAESRPGREGIGVAERLATLGLAVTITTDAGVAIELERWGADVVIVGADAILPDGSVVNKVGTRGAALAAASIDVEVVVAAATDKVDQTGGDPGIVDLESEESTAVYDGDCQIEVANPLFDVTPPSAIDAIVTERGEIQPADVPAIAAEHRDRAGWST